MTKKSVTIRAAWIYSIAIIIAAIIGGMFMLKHNANKNNSITIEKPVDSSNIYIANEKVEIKGDYIVGDKITTVQQTSKNEENNYSNNSIHKKTKSTISDKIESIFIEARLTCDLLDNSSIPLNAVNPMILSDANAYFNDNSGVYPVNFYNPIYCRVIDNNRVVVINRFITNSGSIFKNKPIQFLESFNNLIVPINTLGLQDTLSGYLPFKNIYKFEVVIRINGNDIWYKSWKYDVKFQGRPEFNIPLTEFIETIRN